MKLPDVISLEGLDEKDIEILKKVKEERVSLDSIELEDSKKWNPLGNVMDLLIFVGVICFGLFSAFALLGFAYSIFFAGFPLTDLWIVLGIAALLGCIGIAVLFLMIMQAGDWFKIGRALKSKKGDGWLKFTASGRLILNVEKKAKLMNFNKMDKLSKFFAVHKGYIEPTTGAVFHTVREGAPTDFDVNEEYKFDVEEMSPVMSNRMEQQWDAGVNWNKTDKNMLLIFVIIAMLLSGVCLIVTIGNLYFSSDTMGKMDKKIDGISGTVTAIEKSFAEPSENSGIITEGGG
jgi:hypothetical protein